MKERLKEIVEYLIENTDYNKDQIIMIINPLETESQAQQLLTWIKTQKPMIWYLMRKKALQIAEKN